jgi:hypothetical protein
MDPGPEDVTWEELRQHAEASWRLTGPNSKGGTSLYRYRGRLFVVGYGESSPRPDGAEQVLGELPDNTPGFPPALAGGHAAGCAHERHWDWDWWLHRTFLLRVESQAVTLWETGRQTWTCALEAFARPDSSEGADVLHKLGPNVLDEALRCAARRLARNASG